MKRITYLTLVIALAVISCKKEKKFAEPEYIFAKWTRAVERLNYADYASCEAYPKEEAVFKEIYRDSYYADLMVTGVEGLDEKKIHQDGKGDSFMSRNVQFECSEIRRKDRKPLRVLRGDVDFIKFIGGDRVKQGWLMWNRKIIRIDR
ncbi:MAG: hypothetical protein A2W19_11250 [Spirochaetes bacterium RBG_16_49_21]|nr:MAG: hypothetical protein A2W19_11250 [Spirochaetes bacterium RBG_16_49_21]